MSDELDPLEAELLALRPHDVSPRLRRQVAVRLAASPPAKLHRLGWLLAAACGLAACLAAILIQRQLGRPDKTQPIAIRPQPAPVVEQSIPTLLDYRAALARSPEALDALLDIHVVSAPDADPELVNICAFTRSDATIHALLGEN